MAQDYHEPAKEMSEKDRDRVRAIKSLIEEIEAVFWYTQRVAVSDDKAVADIMQHNAEEEMEHAMMLLEWLRRNQKGWDSQMRTYLFTEKPIMELEDGDDEEDDSPGDSQDLKIGQLD
ncbi:MAG: ferritin-like domain-containing protein [Tissierellia bacterium]|nr:ferritin-like domain-containing protein [Tissierellia bacterium]